MLEEREVRGRLWQRKETESILYLYITYLSRDAPDVLDVVYRDHQRTRVGMGYPVPPPKSLGAHT